MARTKARAVVGGALGGQRYWAAYLVPGFGERRLPVCRTELDREESEPSGDPMSCP